MTNVPKSITKIQVEETDFKSPSSEQLHQKYGGNINALIDLLGNSETFTSDGTFTVPESVNRVAVIGIGGGGGGGSGDNVSVSGGYGGAGGGAANGYLTIVEVTPNNDITVTIGNGGDGGDPVTSDGPGNEGSPGEDSFFGNLKFEGGKGTTDTTVDGTRRRLGGRFNERLLSNVNARGGDTFVNSNSNIDAQDGEKSLYSFIGGTKGGSQGDGNPGAGGAASILAKGGDGSDGVVSVNTQGDGISPDGEDGQFGSGGGGSGSAGSESGRGGKGGNGKIIVLF